MDDDQRRLAQSAIADANLWLDDEDSMTFDGMRDDDESYVAHILHRAMEVGPLHAAVEDFADAHGSVDYGETIPALRAVLVQWHRAADSLNPGNSEALRVRMFAIALEDEMKSDGFDNDYCTDLISIEHMKNTILNRAAELRMLQDGAGDEDAWWDEYGAEIAQIAGIRNALIMDLANRDETLPPGS